MSQEGHKINEINYLRGVAFIVRVNLVPSFTCEAQAELDDVRKLAELAMNRSATFASSPLFEARTASTAS